MMPYYFVLQCGGPKGPTPKPDPKPDPPKPGPPPQPNPPPDPNPNNRFEWIRLETSTVMQMIATPFVRNPNVGT